MRRLRATTIVLLGIAILAPGSPAVDRAAAQGAAGPLGQRAAPIGQDQRFEDRYFGADWHQAAERSTVLSGCVYNRSVIRATKVRVTVEGLDAKDAVVGSTDISVSTVPAGSSGHFEFPALTGASKYRARVVSFEWPQS